MKKYFFIVLGLASISVCVFGLLRYGALTWLIFLALGVYFLFKSKIRTDGTTNNKVQEQKHEYVTGKNSSEPDKSFTFPIVGVMFKNDDGSERQYLLRKIYFKDAPFDVSQEVTLERYLWKGDPAYYVKVNEYIVGNIGDDFVWYFEKNADRKYKIEYIKVYGGNGKNYGAEIHGIYLDVNE